MGVSFPNAARSFDEKTRCVRFSGYDGIFEIKFYLASEVLASEMSGRMAPEADLLTTFDSLRPRILRVAASTYLKSKSNTIALDLGDFR